jgi:ureidoglycolate lyase
MASREISIEPLTKVAFRGFGDVIERDPESCFPTNDGEALRHHDIARVDVAADGGRVAISIFQVVKPAVLPFPLRLMERHPISSQGFIPLGQTEFIVVVAPSDVQPDVPHLRAFRARAGQGVNLHPGVWHHPLIALDLTDFLVVDRTISGAIADQDYEEVRVDGAQITVVA